MTSSVTIHSGEPSVVIDAQSSSVDVDAETMSTEIDHDGAMPSMDYRTLVNKPSINEVPLIGDKSLEEIGVVRITNAEIKNLVGRRKR